MIVIVLGRVVLDGSVECRACLQQLSVPSHSGGGGWPDELLMDRGLPYYCLNNELVMTESTPRTLFWMACCSWVAVLDGALPPDRGGRGVMWTDDGHIHPRIYMGLWPPIQCRTYTRVRPGTGCRIPRFPRL